MTVSFKRVMLLSVLAYFSGVPAYADCTNPAAKEADVIYNGDYHTYQFCNGTSWIPFGPAGSVGGGSDTSFVTGESLGTLRNDFTGPVGFGLVVGASNITVTQLGRWVVSGNSGSHVIRLYDSGCSILGTATVNTSGATAGQFAYGALSPSTTLTAGGTYYIESVELSGGDQWYSNDTTIVTTAAGTNSAYFNCNSAFGAANSAYVPVDFKYH